MDSWTLQGDSYSFLRSAPRTFSLCHRDGTPNHVEIFDIINVPAQHSSISETTCLCDIFGDEGDSPSLSSSPAVGTFVHPHTDVDGTASGASLVDDLNDSSGSYHTAPGSSEGEEGFDDSLQRLQSPPLQNSSSEGRQSEREGVTLEQPDSFEETRPNTDRKSTSPVLAFGAASSPGERISSPARSRLCTPRPREGTSPVSSLSAEERHSPASSDSRRSHSEADFERLTPVSEGQHNSHSYQALTPSPISDSSKRISSSSTESVNTRLTPEIRLAQNSPQPRSCNFSSASPELPSKDIAIEFPESTFQSRDTVSSPLYSEFSKELSFSSREASVSPELKNRPTSCNTQASSPFSELRGRVSLPDLLSRGSTPSIEESHSSPEPISTHCQAGIDITPISTPDSKSTSLSVEAGSTLSSPAPRYTPPSPVILIASSPGIVEISVSPKLSNRDPSPGLLSAPSPVHSRNPSPSPSPKLRHISTPTEINTQAFSPVASYSLSPSPEFRRDCSPLEHRHTAPSPEIRITTSSPEPQIDVASSRSPTSSPHITGFSYTVVQPEERVSPAFLHPSRLSTPDSDRSESKSPTQISVSHRSSTAESTGTPRESPQVSEFTSCDLQPEISPPGLAAAAYSDPAHSHSPGLPPMDPQYMCGPQSLGPSYGSEYGGDSASVYSESSYGQTPRRVLLDPETGKYFYIEVPVQPLRKMLYDPETGQYVEVLIPQQAVSHSGLYPPSAAPYPSLHNPNMYAPAPQYMPYTAPPPAPAPPPPGLPNPGPGTSAGS
uniref:DUF4585 domain-containing protein n=1 Tax=Cynoglossus semilaevis TaxID=244447 RepID=A0A3P8WHE9_CYNSE